VKISSFSLKISKCDREKLQDSWQEDVGSNKGIGKLEALVKRHQVQVWDLNGLQEFRIFHKGIKVKQKTSLLGTLPVKIWLYFGACAGNKNRKSR